MATQEEKQAYINEMASKRGYVLEYHKVLTEYDFDVMKSMNEFIKEIYLKPRRLDRKTKELIFTVALTVTGGTKGHLKSHMRMAMEAGATAAEVLEAIELAIPEAGVVAFQNGFDAWRELVDARGIEPTVPTFDATRS